MSMHVCICSYMNDMILTTNVSYPRPPSHAKKVVQNDDIEFKQSFTLSIDQFVHDSLFVSSCIRHAYM